MNAPTTIRVDLSPRPGFCIKSTALESAVCKVSARPDGKLTGVSAALLPDAINVPKGVKVFVNVAWDANVPPPPEGSEEAIQKAMSGEQEVDEEALANGHGWFVPVVVCDPRSDVDKGEIRLLSVSSYSVTLSVFRSSLECLLSRRLDAFTGRDACKSGVWPMRARSMSPEVFMLVRLSAQFILVLVSPSAFSATYAYGGQPLYISTLIFPPLSHDVYSPRC